jgi:hypothetical protein
MDSSEQGQKTWVVQARHENGKTWVDVATITTPARTKRREIIRQALENYTPNGQAVLRVLDEKSAATSTVELVPRDPELRIR